MAETNKIYLDKIKIIDEAGNTVGDQDKYRFSIGTLREDNDGNIVYGPEENAITLIKYNEDKTYTLMINDTPLEKYIDERDSFLKGVKYDSNTGELTLSFQIGNGDEIKDLTVDLSEILNLHTYTEVTSEKDLPKTAKEGDIAIVKTNIGGTSYTEKTAYVYDGEKWMALDGNYNARNVFFDKNFTFTKAIGTVTIPSSGSKVVQAEGKNLYDFFAGLFAAEDTEPDISNQPSVNTATLNKAGSYEAGTELTGITYSATFEDGKYQYGPEPTGVTVTAWEAKTNGGVVVGTAASGSIADMEVAADTNYYLTLKATYGAGSYAKTNLGNESTVRIAAGSKTKNTSAIKGYRNTFYGTINNASTELTSDVIRKLTKSGKTLTNGSTFTIDVPASAKKAIIAVPKGLGISGVAHREGLGAPVLSTFTPQEITIEGANGNAAIIYDVYVASVGYSSTNHYDVTI